MNRFGALPITARLSIAFASALTVVLGLTSWWVYERQSDGVDRAVAQRLADRREDLETRSRLERNVPARELARDLVAGESGLLQVYSADGDVITSARQLHGRRVVERRDALRATRAGAVRNVTLAGDRENTARVEYFAVEDAPIVLAVVESTRSGHEALERLATELLVGAAAAVLLGSVLAYWLARAALRPVERLRSAAQIHALSPMHDPLVLPVPAARDEVARLGSTLNELLARTHASTRRERQFIAEAGHELRTPLATMLAEIELALETTRDDGARAALTSVHEEATRLAVLAATLLQHAAQRERAEFATVDLVALIEEHLERWRALFRELDIQLSLPRESAVVEGDRIALGRALDNLVENAAVHGGSSALIRIDVQAASIDLHVVDDGPGIADDVAARAFDPFARADDARARRGAGLGLAIVHDIAAAHGGTATIERAAASRMGTDAWISLPRHQARTPQT